MQWNVVGFSNARARSLCVMTSDEVAVAVVALARWRWLRVGQDVNLGREPHVTREVFALPHAL